MPVLLDAIVRDDGVSAPVGELLRRSTKRLDVLPVRAQVQAYGYVQPEQVPHLFLDEQGDEDDWRELLDLGEIAPARVTIGHASLDRERDRDLRLRWKCSASLASWRLYVWVGAPAVVFG